MRIRLNNICPLISKECDDWLESIGYYEKPAALKHHKNGTKDGALFAHSIVVMDQLEWLTSSLGLEWERPESPAIVGLLHDVCKCNDYVKVNGIWQYNDEETMAGHGVKSIIMLAGHIDLTDEELHCIRYHMGAFTEQSEWQYYGRAVEKYPNVLYTHTADMIASKIKGI